MTPFITNMKSDDQYGRVIDDIDFHFVIMNL